MKKHTWLLTGLSVASVITIPVISASCTTKTPIFDKPEKVHQNSWYTTPYANYHEVGKEFYKKFRNTVFDRNTFTETEVQMDYWQLFNYADGVVESLADGDTMTITLTSDSWHHPWLEPTFRVGASLKIRIEGIDTLEEAVPNTVVPADEKKWAKRDHEFAETLTPVGSNVRVVFTNPNNTSYNRQVAHVFFGENYYRNFSVEMLAGAVTLARLSTEEISSFESNYKSDVKRTPSAILMPYMAYAFNEGIKEKRGFYNPTTYKDENGNYEYFESPKEFTEMYHTHGETMIINSFYIFDEALLPKGYSLGSRNIYKFIEKNK